MGSFVYTGTPSVRSRSSGRGNAPERGDRTRNDTLGCLRWLRSCSSHLTTCPLGCQRFSSCSLPSIMTPSRLKEQSHRYRLSLATAESCLAPQHTYTHTLPCHSHLSCPRARPRLVLSPTLRAFTLHALHPTCCLHPTCHHQAFADFKRTHQDNWAKHRERFTPDQQDLISDMLVMPSFYA